MKKSNARKKITERKKIWIEVDECRGGKTVLFKREDKIFRIVAVRDYYHTPSEGVIDKLPDDHPYWGIILERWDATPDLGWLHVDSLFGISDDESDLRDHYVVEEHMGLAEEVEKYRNGGRA